MSLVLNVILGVGVVALLVARQLRTRPVDEDKAYKLPVILVVVAVVQGGLVDKVHPVVSVVLLVAELVVAVLFGLLRASTVRVWRDEWGGVWRRGTGWTAGAWLVSLLVRVAMIGVGYVAGITPQAGGILLFLGVSLLAQNTIVVRRARTLPAVARVSVMP